MGGQVATQNSWPSIALIVFKYKFNYVAGGSTYTSTTSTICGGTLIDKNTILTTAHCYVTSVSYTYGGSSYTYAVRTNSYYSTIASMYTVYLGLHDKTGIFDGVTSISPGVAMSISRFTIVIYSQLII